MFVMTANAAASGNDTLAFTASFTSGGVYIAARIYAITGANISAPIDVMSAYATMANGTTLTMPDPGATVQNGDLLLSSAMSVPGYATSVTPGWTSSQQCVCSQAPDETSLSQSQSSAGPFNPATITYNTTTGNAIAVSVAIAPAPTVTPPPPTASPLPSPSSGTSAAIAGNWGCNSSGSLSPQSMTCTTTANPGAQLTAFVDTFNSSSTAGCATLTVPAGWTIQGSPSCQNQREEVWVLTAAGAAVGNDSVSFSATFSAGSLYMAARVYAITGANLTSPIDRISAYTKLTNGATLTMPDPGSTNGNGDVLLSNAMTAPGYATAVSAGWTKTQQCACSRAPDEVTVAQAQANAGPFNPATITYNTTTGNALAVSVAIAPTALVPTPSPAPAYVDWNTFGYDLQRTGYNPNETTLSPSALSGSPLKQVWATDLGAPITSQPVLATNVNVAGTPTNVLYVGAENNVFSAVNADTGAVVWRNTSLGSPIASSCDDLPGGQFGITATATYDRTSGLVYVADANDNIDALDMTTGSLQWSVNALYDPNTNSTIGSPAQDYIYTALTYNPANGMLYAGTASFCDQIPWHGRLVAINTATHTVTAAFFPGRVTGGKTGTAYCGGGFWGMGGASIDSTTNDVYIATGNVATSATGGCAADSKGETYPYGDAVVQLDPQLNYISSDAANVNGTKASNDSDYGATAMLYSVPNCTSLQLSAKNKNGFIYTYGVSSMLTAEQQLHVGNTSSTGDFIGVPAFDPVTNLVYVGNPNANGNYAHGLNALSQSSGCSGLTLAWKASIGSSNVTSDDNQAPTVARRCVLYGRPRQQALGLQRLHRRAAVEQRHDDWITL
ncbi:MAG TPA: PQQ-binding-like beta-propeller repeat protein [Candidatus Baltobacteraceae bacterium]|nr:PQQ-binding-like beta-propeller repeat protein [Candidatus Baltobacteraceae bacterium]